MWISSLKSSIFWGDLSTCQGCKRYMLEPTAGTCTTTYGRSFWHVVFPLTLIILRSVSRRWFQSFLWFCWVSTLEIEWWYINDPSHDFHIVSQVTQPPRFCKDSLWACCLYGRFACSTSGENPADILGLALGAWNRFRLSIHEALKRKHRNLVCYVLFMGLLSSCLAFCCFCCS